MTWNPKVGDAVIETHSDSTGTETIRSTVDTVSNNGTVVLTHDMGMYRLLGGEWKTTMDNGWTMEPEENNHE